MKNQVQKLSLLLLTILGYVTTFAQEGKKLDVDVKIGNDAQMWYQNPLYWVIGALLLIILVAMMTRGGNNK